MPQPNRFARANTPRRLLIRGIRKLNDMLEGTKLLRLDVNQIEAMIHRDSLALLGLRS